MVRVADVRPCPNCASKVVPVSICNTCGSVAVRPDLGDVDRKIDCTECKSPNPTLFVCEKCNNRFLFEEVAGPLKEQFACLLCGTFVDADAKACPACGAIFEEETPHGPVAKHERPKRRVRGEFTDADVDEIARIPGVGRAKAEALARAGYNALWKIKRASEEELARVRLIGARSAKTVKDSLRFILLLPRRKSKEEVLQEEYACPLCACVTSLFAKTCAECGAVFDEEEIDDELRREVEKEREKGLLAFYDVHLQESPDDPELWYARALLLLDLGELQEAMKSIDTAARIDPGSRRVMTVRSRVLAAMHEMKQSAQALRGTLTGLVQEAKEKVEVLEAKEKGDADVLAAANALDSLSALTERECPVCGQQVVPDATVCPACGNKLQPGPTPAVERVEIEPGPEPPAEFAALEELEKMVAQAPRVQEPEEEPAKEAEEVAPEATPEPAKEFPPLPPPPPSRERRIPAPPPRAEPAAPRRPIETPSPRARTVPPPQARFRRGLINGHGLINGSGRVNGLVNGLGFMDTSALTDFRLPPRTLLFRYSVITSSLLLAFAIAAALLPAPAAPAAAIRIDGNPGDWASLPRYADASVASDPNVAIEQYGLFREGGSLSVLIQVAGVALGDPVGNDAFYAFFDTDASAATGYRVRGLGAEYVAEVIGGAGQVYSARLLEFPSNAEVNWTRRSAVTGISAAAAGQYLEFQVPTDEFASFSPTSTTILIAADDFEGAAARASVALTATFGAVRVRQVPLLGILPPGTTPALRLEVAAVGEIAPGDSVVVGPFTFTATAGLTVLPNPAQVTLTRAGPTASVAVSVTGVGLPAGTPIVVDLQSAPSQRPVTVSGPRLEAYFSSVPPGIRIDGLFADWSSLAVSDSDALPVSRGSLDIRSYGGAANASGTFFMLQVAGPLLEGSVAPQRIARLTQSGGGSGTQGPPGPRITGEDIARVLIDTNVTDSNGVAVGGIFADYMIEVHGRDGAITSRDVYRWQSGWVPDLAIPLQAEKNETAIEGSLGLNPSRLNGTRMIFQTSEWSGTGDATTILLTRSAPVGGTRDPGRPVVMDISGNGQFWFHDSNYGTETACKYNKVADTTHGAGPVANISLSAGDCACWYVDPTTGATIPAGDWETLLDIFQEGSGAAYEVRFDIWNKDTHTIAEPVGSCLAGGLFGDDVQCFVGGVAEKVLTSTQVVRVNITNSGSGPVIYIEYDDSGATGDSRTTLPLPEFQEIALPAALVLLVVLFLRIRRKGSTKLSR